MQACLDIVLPYVHERQQFGQAIGEFQLIQARGLMKPDWVNPRYNTASTGNVQVLPVGVDISVYLLRAGKACGHVRNNAGA